MQGLYNCLFLFVKVVITVFALYLCMQALGLTAPSLLAAGMAADNLAMAVYFGVIMSIPTEGKEATTETFTGA